MDNINRGPDTQRKSYGKGNNATTRFNILGLPKELVAKILLKLCARSEAISKVVCKDFNGTTQCATYKSARQVQKMGEKQEPQYCGVSLSAHPTRASRGWDPVAQEWVDLPSLAFLHNVHADNKGELSKLTSTRCICDGLMCVELTDRSSSYNYVCNPLTKSYVSIDISQDLNWSHMEMLAGDGEPGFSIVAGVFDKGHTTLTLFKLESSDLAAGWLQLPPLPADVWAPQSTSQHVLVGGKVHLLYISRTNKEFRYMSFDMEDGLWSSHPVIISGHSAPGSPLSSKRDPEEYKQLNLSQVGGKVWLVQLLQQQAFLKRYERTGDVEIMTSEASVCRYKPEEEKFILEETRQIPLCETVLGNGCASMICFIDHNKLPWMYDVSKKRWFKSHRRVYGPEEYRSRSLPFQLSHASVT